MHTNARDEEWIAAKHALSLARSDLWETLRMTAYDALPEPLRTLRCRYDEADKYLRSVQSERAAARITRISQRGNAAYADFKKLLDEAG